jgi:hypothetical protein
LAPVVASTLTVWPCVVHPTMLPSSKSSPAQHDAIVHRPRSLSWLTRFTLAGTIPAYSGSALVVAAKSTWYATMPSLRASSTPVTVTVRAALQLAGVNVSEPTLVVPSEGSSLAKLTVTSAVGSLSSATVNVAWPPASVVGPLAAETVIPAVSSSVLVSATLLGAIAA